MHSITVNGAKLKTPKKKIITVPTQALADAITREWAGQKTFKPSVMPFTALANAAFDVVAENRELIVESLMTYAETDLLCYRAETKDLALLQEQAWESVLAWARSRYDVTIQVTVGIMPVEQSAQMLSVLQNILRAYDDFTLAALALLAPLLGSLWLALAIVEKHLGAAEAFGLSRLDETYQAEQWGVDEAAQARTDAMKREVEEAGRFLRLLE